MTKNEAGYETLRACRLRRLFARKAWICANRGGAHRRSPHRPRFTDPARTSPIANTPGTAGLELAIASPAVVTKPFAVDLDLAVLQPFGARIGAEEQEHVADRARLLAPGCRGVPR